MRRSRDAAAESRRQIVRCASRLMRERGIEKLGVADVMAAAGMTHGGFYKHFRSKNDLVAEALAAAFDGHVSLFDAQAEAEGHEAARAGYVSRYLSLAHVEQPGRGCPVAALGGEIARAEPPIRQAYSQGAERILHMLAAPNADDADARRIGAATFATLVGAVVAARAADSDVLREEVLTSARSALAREF